MRALRRLGLYLCQRWCERRREAAIARAGRLLDRATVFDDRATKFSSRLRLLGTRS